MKEKKAYVKATSDIFIKYLFGLDTKESDHLVISFINAVLTDSDFPVITKVVQKNPFNYQEFADDKLSVLDIEVEDENHKLYNIEVQSSGNTHFRNRALYYWAKLYTSQSREGDLYDSLLPTIGINILDFTLFPELSGYHNFFVIAEGREREYILTDQLIIHFLEIPKIKDAKMSSKMISWLLYLKAEGQDKEMLKILLENDEDLKSAHEMYKAFNNNDKLRRYALSREKAENDRKHFLHMARKQGLEEGIERGELEDKHNVLIRQLELKYSLSVDEKKHIISINEFNKLDAALDAVVLAKDKENILKLL